MRYQITTKIPFFKVAILFLLAASLFSLFASEEKTDHQTDLVERIQEGLPDIRVIRENKVSINQKSIGSGAFGNVYKGKWEDEQKEKESLVFKEINIPEARANLYGQGNSVQFKDIEELIIWEAVRSSQLSHPNVMEFEGIYQEKGTFYLVSKFYNRGNLQRYLQNNNVIPSQQLIIKWMLDITHGLMYLHQQGILHRDLKADNIFIDELNRARLGDFGVVQVDSLIDTKSPTVVNMGIQSRRFKAPESVIEWSHSSKKTDIYALGLVFWQLIHNGNNPGYTWQWMKDILQKYVKLYINEENKKKINEQQDDAISPLREISQEAREEIRILFGQSHELPARELIFNQFENGELRNLIHQCWSNNPEFRPSLYYIENALYSLLDDNASIMKACAKIKKSLHGKLHGDYVIPIDASCLNANSTSSERKAVTEIFKEFLSNPQQQIMILAGSSGSGKTHSTYKLCDEIINKWEQCLMEPSGNKSSDYFPILVRQSCPKWSATNLKGILEKSLNHYEINKDLFSTGVKPLFIIDGYDECIIDVDDESIIYEDNQDSIEKHIKDVPDFIGLKEFPGSKLIVTNCLVEGEKLEWFCNQFKSPYNLYKIDRITLANLQDYIENSKRYLTSTVYQKYKKMINDLADINDFLLTPLLLTMFSKHIEKFSEVNIGDLENPRKWFYELTVKYSFEDYQHFLSELSVSDKKFEDLKKFEDFIVSVAKDIFEGEELSGQQYWETDEEIKKASQDLYESTPQTNRSFLTKSEYQEIRLLQFRNITKKFPLQKKEDGKYEFAHASFLEFFVVKPYEGNEDFKERFQSNPLKCIDFLRKKNDLQRLFKLFQVYMERYWDMERLHHGIRLYEQNFYKAGGTEQEYSAMIPSDPEVKEVIEQKLKKPHVWYSFHNLITKLLSVSRIENTREKSSVDCTIESFLSFIKENYETNNLEYKEGFKKNPWKCFYFLSEKYNEQYLNAKFPASEHEPIDRTSAIKIFLLDRNIQYGWMWANIFARQYTIISGDTLQFDGYYLIHCKENIPNGCTPIMRKLEINHAFKRMGGVKDLHGPLLRNALRFSPLYDFEHESI